VNVEVTHDDLARLANQAAEREAWRKQVLAEERRKAEQILRERNNENSGSASR
jgi:hypothetical protein